MTLHKHSSGLPSRVGGGRLSVLSKEEERELVTICAVLQEVGFPLTKDDVTAAVCQYLTENSISNHFKNEFPGESWWREF
jgi:hypothetical protein